MMNHYRLNPAIIQKPLSQFASGEGGEDAGEAKDGEYNKGHIYTPNESCVILRCNLHVADVDAKN